MAFLLPSEFRAPADQEVYSDFDESEYEEIVAKLIVIQQAIIDKPVKHQHLKALYVRGFVDGKPMSKMLVDGGASVNLSPHHQVYAESENRQYGYQQQGCSQRQQDRCW